jgi:adenylate cyclase class IV
MREVELKAVVDDLAARRERLENAGASLRTYVGGGSVKCYLDWKGPTEVRDVYKTREEISTRVEDADALREILARLGFVVTMAIDREIAQYKVHGATVRFETYPRMDVLVEVEGQPGEIEQAIEALGIARGQFTSERLNSFVQRFENRTGVRAAISRDEAEATTS